MANAVLVALDSSDPARAALEHACRNHPDATITALHVVDPADQSSYTSMTGAPTVETQATKRRQEERVESLFDDAQHIADEYGVVLSTEMRTGDPAKTVATVAEEGNFDLIVVGSHGREGVTRILLGSVAERIVRRAPVPVTIVR
ncbi:universal stress protein [Halostagnicola sp. A-GB9-2]|uniref:universal stress protein n=1 Tax=Halostagnicola sp. A-GB9-2 TaxID=3048066 RepID=UPI0024C026D8|nr:universal stress protein [Halostagnicola sp. A-GB9-2]MDJ1430708.1 universal stress protein [Halostagnicola sp. A-GB9-2]